MNKIIQFYLLIITFSLVSYSVFASKNKKTVIDATEYGYAQINIIKNQSLVFVSGQVGFDTSKNNDFTSQVDRAFESLDKALKKAGSSAENVTKITLLIADHDPEKLDYLIKKRKSFFKDAYPASTLIPVTRLYQDGVSFEIDAVAILP